MLDALSIVELLIKIVLDVSAFLQNHSINDQDASGRIHAEFPTCLKEYVSVMYRNDEIISNHTL